MDWIVSLTPGCSDEPYDALSAPPEGASIVELRVDLFPGIDLHRAVTVCPLPVLMTLRSMAEGGEGADDPEERRRFIVSAQEAGAALIDLEYRRDRAHLTGLGLEPERVVLSWHSFKETPADLDEVCEAMLATPARWIKVIPTAGSLIDLQRLLSLHPRFNRDRVGQRRLITFAMGVVGLPSRYLAPLLGPPLTYAAWDESAPAAPGQVSIRQLQGVIGHLSAPPQRLYGVIGGDVSRSRSPLLHGAGYRAHQLPYLMVPVSVPDPNELELIFVPRGEGLFDQVGLPAWGWAVTTPHKAAAAAAATMAAPRVKKAGAANTLILQSGQVVAENTDADGVPGALRSAGFDPLGMTAVVQGTGGAGRGGAIGLHLAGAEVALRGRDPDRSRDQADKLGVGWTEPDQLPKETAILVNATPLGSRPDDKSPFTAEEVASASVVVDMVYATHPTTLEKLATAAGIAFVSGLDILAHQGYAQFAAFTGKLPAKNEMRRALD
jgi:3-dehydroquinate dehydratase/shikimate dehydrogenase